MPAAFDMGKEPLGETKPGAILKLTSSAELVHVIS